jgi:recombination protein RecA
MDLQVQEARNKALQVALDQIEKAHGKGSVMRLGDQPHVKIESISTGSLSLDAAIGIGGVPRGRVIEIFGPESSGKTTVCLHIIAEAQKNGGNAAFIDAEHALDVKYAERLGVKLNDLILAQPEYGEQALDILEQLVRSAALDVIIVDSVAALTPRAEIEGEMGDAQMGAQARLMSQAMRKTTAAIGKSNTTVIFTNQLRSKIGVLYGNPETTTGGNALKFYSSLRLDIRRRDVIKEGSEIIGNRVRVKVVKNKMAPPFKEVEFDILYNEGISRMGDLIDVAIEHNIIQKAGSWFSFGTDKIGQGRESVKAYLKEYADAYEKVARAVKEKLGIIVAEPVAAGPGENGVAPSSNGKAKK